MGPTGSRKRARRSDADRSRSAILAAAIARLSEDPDSTIEAIASAAGVTRQTVYAHFPSRDALSGAIADQLTAEAVAAFSKLDLDTGPAMDALVRLIDTSIQIFEQHPIRLYPAAAAGDQERHEPVADLLTKVIRRGQTAGEFSRDFPVSWLVKSTIALSHAAAELPPRKARTTLHATLRRLLAVG